MVNLDKLLRLYNASSGSIKRKISLAAYTANSYSWFKEHKKEYAMMDSWNKCSMIIGSKLLQPDERRFFFAHYNSSIVKDDFMEIFLKKWACK